MKYLVLFLLVMFSCNVNAEIKEYYQKLYDSVRESKKDEYSKFCFKKNVYGKLDYTDHNCIMTYYFLLTEMNRINIDIYSPSDTWSKNYLDSIRLQKLICADLQAKNWIDHYKIFCTYLEQEQRIYEDYKNDCMKDEPNHPLVCFSYKFE